MPKVLLIFNKPECSERNSSGLFFLIKFDKFKITKMIIKTNKVKALIFGLLIGTSCLFSQNTNDFHLKFEKTKELCKEGNYYAALPMYLELYRMDTTNANICYLIGDCYLKARSEKVKALPFLKKALGSVSHKYKEGSSEEKNAPLLSYKLLGDAYHIHSMFDKAIQSYETYKKEMIFYKMKDADNLKEANRKIEMCLTGKQLMAAPVKVKIENMGKNINSPYADYSPVLTADQSNMIFTTRRKESTGGLLTDDGKYFEDIYISNYDGKNWSVATSIGKPINTDGNEASVGISPDGQEILIYKDDNGDGNIYSTTLNGDVWSTPIKLNENINSKHWEPSAFITLLSCRVNNAVSQRQLVTHTESCG